MTELESYNKSSDYEHTRPTYKTRLARLNKAEKYWSWKAGLRMAVVILSIMGIGCTGWIISSSGVLTTSYSYGFGYGLVGLAIGALVTFILAFLWCSFSIVFPLFFNRSLQPLHPGWAVGLDLCFWGGFLTLGMFMLTHVFYAVGFGSAGRIYDPTRGNSYAGEYYRAPNNTWVYNITWTPGSSGRFNSTTRQWEYPPLNTTGVVRSCTRYFTSCEAQDEWINKLYNGKAGRVAATSIADGCAWLNLLLFFALFVWACVDTHRYNTRTSKKKVQVIADQVISDLAKRGFININAKDGVVQPAVTTQAA